MTHKDIDQAREWASWLTAQEPQSKEIRAAAEVINALPDEWFDADDLREWMNDYIQRPRSGDPTVADVLIDLQNRFLTPSLPTLADMAPEEREACQWMQARLDGETESVVIANLKSGKAWVMWDDGVFDLQAHDKVTPLPDLPKLEWPGSHADTITAESVEDMQAGRVADFEPDLPRPEDVPDPQPGEAWLVNTREGEQREALKAGNRWYVKDGDDVEEWAEEALTPIARLVPEVTA